MMHKRMYEKIGDDRIRNGRIFISRTSEDEDGILLC